MIEEFSNGYYRAEMHVEPYEDGPVIEQGLYDHIESNVYAQTDANPLFRVGLDTQPYFMVGYESAIPIDTLGIPKAWFSDFGIDHTVGTVSVFVCKPEQSYYLQAGGSNGYR